MQLAKSKILDARCRIQVNDIWYGVFSVRMNWIEDKRVGTMGVAIKSGGKINCYYSPEWCDTLSIEQLIAVIKHEIEHITRMHLERHTSEDHYKSKLYNIAADWVINGLRDPSKREARGGIKDLPQEGTFLPEKGDPEWEGVCLDDVTTSSTTEELYEFLLRETKKEPNGGGDDDKGFIARITANGKILTAETVDSHGTWKESTASNEEMRQTAKEMCRAATAAAGNTPGHLTELIAKLEKPQYNWLHELGDWIGRLAGKKRLTYSRVSRRHRRFGVKGTSTHGNIPLTIHVDRSGSMGMAMLQRVFSEIEAISQHFRITLIVFDTMVHSVERYHKGDWKKIKLGGGGGTNFLSSIAHAEEHGLVGQVNLLITDGFDGGGKIEERGYPFLWVIIGKQGQEYFKNVNSWGKIIAIKDPEA